MSGRPDEIRAGVYGWYATLNDVQRTRVDKLHRKVFVDWYRRLGALAERTGIYKGTLKRIAEGAPTTEMVAATLAALCETTIADVLSGAWPKPASSAAPSPHACAPQPSEP